MKWLAFVLLATAFVACGARKPTARDPVARTYERVERQALMTKLVEAMAAEGIAIANEDEKSGLIVSDSFDVPPEYCDCGRNFFGAEYPGQRRGVMRIRISGEREFKISFDFKTRLLITGNNRQLICTSFGILEEKILSALATSLGISREGR